jgi:uncharacterized membrane protein
MAAAHEVEKPGSGKLSLWLWLAQVVLALAFAAAGAMKLLLPVSQLAASNPAFEPLPQGLVWFIGTAEVAGALGMILPAVSRILPVLTPLAAAGLAVNMVLASGYHISRSEWQSIPVTVFLGGLAVFVAWGRTRGAPIAPRS